MFTQKYPNNIRTVSGTATVYEDDVTLNCDTSGAAVTVPLMSITANYWSTQYKLLVVDASNNAATNNITITAPIGCKINGASSVTINTNGGSAVVTIVNNTNYNACISSTGSSSASLPYFYAQKLMQDAVTTYITQDGAGKFSVLSGQAQSTYSSSTSSNLSGFNATTGVWTVPTTGYYSISAKMVTRLLDGDVNSIVDGGGVGWMTSGNGYMAIAVVNTGGGGLPAQVVCSEKQTILTDLVSDINIECTADLFYLTAGSTIQVYVLNKTNHDVMGMASNPTCYIDFSAIKIS